MLTESTLNNVQCWGVGLAEKWISRYTEMDCYFCFQVFSFSFPFMPSSMAQLLLLTSLRESRQSMLNILKIPCLKFYLGICNVKKNN